MPEILASTWSTWEQLKVGATYLSGANIWVEVSQKTSVLLSHGIENMVAAWCLGKFLLPKNFMHKGG